MSDKPPLHGRDHRAPGTNSPTDPGGADPIPGLEAVTDAIRFDVQNDGNWLDIRTDTDGGTESVGILLSDTSTSGIEVNSTGQIHIVSNVASDVYIQAGNSTIRASEDVVRLATGTDGTPAGLVQVVLGLGGTSGANVFRVESPDSGAIFEVRDDGSVHGKSGFGPMVFDL